MITGYEIAAVIFAFLVGSGIMFYLINKGLAEQIKAKKEKK